MGRTPTSAQEFGLKLDLRSGVPVYRQIIDQVRGGIAGGTLAAGDQLPTVRQLAVDLAINPNTVLKAYRELELGGALETHQGTGTFISNKELDHLTASVANDARKEGMTRVDHLEFSGDQTTVLATQQNSQQDMFSKHSATNIQQAMQTPPEHAYQQMTQETQRQAQAQAQVQQTAQQQVAQSQQQGPSLGS